MRTAIVRHEELSPEVWTPAPPTFITPAVPLNNELLEGLQPSALSVEIGVVKSGENFRKLDPKEVEKFVGKLSK